MTEFLKSLKADLLDRRLLPALVVLGVALAAAVAFAVLGGGGSASSGPVVAAPVSLGPAGVVVSPSTTSAAKAVAETTSGSSQQRGGLARDPFSPVPGASKPSTSTKTSSSSSSKAKTPSTSAPSARGVGGTTPAEVTTPAPPAKPKASTPVYNVTALFGVAPVGTPPQGPPLTTYRKLKRLTPLPSAQHPIIVFAGVTAGGKSATFTLVGEVILRGSAACFPNASQCQAIELKPGQAEQLEYLPPGGPAVIYELQVARISSVKASTASARHTLRGVSLAGRELLRRAGRLNLPGLRYSATKGVLVFTARARVAPRAGVLRRLRHRD